MSLAGAGSSNRLISAGGVPYIPLGPTQVLVWAPPSGSSDNDLGWLINSGWGYSGVLPISSSAVETRFTFVYRRRRRMKAKKRFAA